MLAKRTSVSCTLLLLMCSLYKTSEGFSFQDFSLGDLLRGSWVPEFIRSRRLDGGTDSPDCTYPGVVAVTASGYMLTTGLFSQGAVLVPTDSVSLLMRVNENGPLAVLINNGSGTVEIPKQTVATSVVNNNDGTSTIKLTTSFSSYSCPTNTALLYQASMNVDVSTCKIASYGGQSLSLGLYQGSLMTSSLSSNPVQGCCSDVLPNLLSKSPNLGSPDVAASPNSYSCAKSQAGICNGDLGGPIYCLDSTTSQRVVVAMVTSGTCQTGETFVTIDFTGGAVSL